MLITPHLLAGAAIGVLSRNPAFAFCAGLASHFLLDMMPHEEQSNYLSWHKEKEKKKIILIAIIDAFFGFSLLSSLLLNKSKSVFFLALLGALAAVLIDILDIGLGKILWPDFRKTFIGKKIHWLHVKFHLPKLKQTKTNIFIGIFSQFAISIISIAIIFSW